MTDALKINDVKNRRILIVDDNEAIHADIRAVLQPRAETSELDGLSALLFDATPAANAASAIVYEIDSAYQGQEGFELVKAAHDAGRPYAMAFVDVRMPPGWDGIQTIREMRKVDPRLQVAVCSAYSDYSWQSILHALGTSDWLLILKKPFDVIEVQQLACALTEKWTLGQRASMRAEDLEKKVREHAGELAAANKSLKEQVGSLAKLNAQLAEEMSARRQADERILHIAFHDALTDLPNRLFIMERMAGCLERTKRQYGCQFAVLYCDLDNFKVINDSLGHRVGDQVLVHVAKTLNSVLMDPDIRSTQAMGVVARLGGDEFIVLLEDVAGEEYALAVAERVRDSLSQPVAIDHHQLMFGVSVGVAMSNADYVDPGELLRDADTALYAAKERGKGCVALFDQEMRAKAKARLELEQDLRRAVEHEEFEVYYQPIVELATEHIVGVEALVRWNHPQQGMLIPDAFIPVAEETGIIEAMGVIVLERAVTQVARWRRIIPGMDRLKLSVNLSPRQLANPNIIAAVDKCLADSRLEPAALRLEITESAMVDDLPKARRVINDLVARGVEIHLDDFGAGYSSLSMLHALPFSTIKLDRSFISSLADELESPITVEALVMLAQHEGINVVAEGIESAEQLAHLRRLDCQYGQGFYFSHPLPSAEAQAYLSQAAGPGALKPAALSAVLRTT